MSTSRIAFRVTFFRFDFAPNVATSLTKGQDRTESGEKHIPYGCNAVLAAGEKLVAVEHGDTRKPSI
jgi:hypothetical protein